MNLIVLSHMYPRASAPYHGIFVKEQVEALRRVLDGAVHVVSPVPWAPRALWFREKWRRYGLAERISEEGGVKVIRPRYPNLPGPRSLHLNGRLMYLSVRRTLSRVLEETGREDTVIHSHALLPDGLAGALAARRFGLKSLCTLHGSDVHTYPHFSAPVYRHCRLGMAMNDSLVAVSEKIKRQALLISPDSTIEVVTNGVDVERFRATRRSDTKQRRILFVGRLETDKGIKELMEGFRLIHGKHRDTRLVLIGEPKLRDWLSGFIRDNGLDGAVEIKGEVDHDALPGHYARAHLFVLPSYAEGMPVSMFEAMAMGLPVVASAVGGVPEVIRHGENGLLIRPRCVDDIVENVSLLLENRALADRIADTALGEVRAKYTWDVSAGKLLARYRELISRDAPQKAGIPAGNHGRLRDENAAA